MKSCPNIPASASATFTPPLPTTSITSKRSSRRCARSARLPRNSDVTIRQCSKVSCARNTWKKHLSAYRGGPAATQRLRENPCVGTSVDGRRATLAEEPAESRLRGRLPALQKAELHASARVPVAAPAGMANCAEKLPLLLAVAVPKTVCGFDQSTLTVSPAAKPKPATVRTVPGAPVFGLTDSRSRTDMSPAVTVPLV